MLRLEGIWLAREPLDMRAGPHTALARVVHAFGAAKHHTAYVFANKQANRMKILVVDPYGVWLAARRLHKGKFVWTALREGGAVELDIQQLRSLIVGLPWHYAGKNHAISVL
mgnify:CR=1 FL=1